MKREETVFSGLSVLLALILSICSVGCLLTGFSLQVQNPSAVWWTCILAAVVFGLCYRIPCGKWIPGILILLAVAALLLIPDGVEVLWHQTRTLLYRITRMWHNAYGIPVVEEGQLQICDLPLMVLGIFQAVSVTGTVHSRKPALSAVVFAFLPLGICLVVTDSVPDQPYIFGILLGVVVLLFLGTVRRGELRQRLEMLALVLIAGAFALSMVFWAAPKKTYVNRTGEVLSHFSELIQELPATLREWGQKYGSGEGSGIQPQRESLDNLGDRIERTYPVMEVTATGEDLLYLRGQDYDFYDGKNWTATRNRADTFKLFKRTPAVWESVHQQVKIATRTEHEVRYVPYYPQADQQMVGGRISNEEALKEYSYVRMKLREDWEELLMLSSTYEPRDSNIYATLGLYDSAKDIWRYRTLPLDTEAKAKELVRTLLQGGESTREIVEIIRRYVENSAAYSLTPERMPSDAEDFALWFLEEAESGYCVHFATATVVLLRAAGIDARYVTGYVTRTLYGLPVQVTQKQAHAWAEYFDPLLQAWLPVEATPADIAGEPVPLGDPDSADMEELTLPTRPEDSRNPSRPVKEEDPETDLPGEGNGPENQKMLKRLKELAEYLRKAAAILLCLAALWGQYRLRLWLRRRQWQRGNPNDRCLALWRECCFLHGLMQEEPPAELEVLAQRAAFSQHTMTAAELMPFTQDLGECQRLLRCMRWYKQLLYRLIYAAY